MAEAEKMPEAVQRISVLILIAIAVWIATVIFHMSIADRSFDYAGSSRDDLMASAAGKGIWQAPDPASLPLGEEGELVAYGRELIENTARYLGPDGLVVAVSNGMNCQNCHLDAGTRPFAPNFSRAASTYPKFRKRSGTVEGFEKRVNDCIERSLNGTPLKQDSRELRAIIAYIQWVGSDASGGTMTGTSMRDLPFLDRAADPVRGRPHYESLCAGCHGGLGGGVARTDGVGWKFPPLWGPQSYNTAAGLYRLSRFAAFVKANMPYGVTFHKPLLTDEQAWDIAAYVNSMPRPHKVFRGDWPVVSDKPIDHPFGPYADGFSEHQHKFGPYGPIAKANSKRDE